MPISFNYPALTLALVVFVVAAFVAWGLKRFAITDSAGFIALIVLPIATYGIATGYISKISTPGGWAAEFREVASANVKPTQLVDEVEDISIIEKAGIDALREQRASVEIGKPIAISLQLGRQGYYNEHAIAGYIRSFLTFDPDLTMIFLEESGKFVASANGNSVLAALALTDYDQNLKNALENSDILALRQLLVLSTNAVRADTTNAQALQMMLNDGVDTIVKVDDTGRAVGIVRRSEILTRLMVKLASG
ncbi:MAG: CBS domain-containing protein [Rhodobacteraceae bacterium]|nr:CBS domain-containing protein [Paracoccaceae bacterium]